ncbi:MAG: kinase-like domain-containing protein [Monoraphidium minutum]|nr:MAG: kinase-like domain-containing protein [Monoraphidium minutum]
MGTFTTEDARRLLPLFEPFAGGDGSGSSPSGAAAAAAADIKQLAGYDDLNFRVSCGGRAFVLKIHCAADSTPAGFAVFEAQSDAMEHVAQDGRVLSNRPVPLACAAAAAAGAAGGGRVAAAEVMGATRAVRMLTYVEGDVMGLRPLSPQLQRALGAFVARLVSALAGFDRPALHGQQGDWAVEGAAAAMRRNLGKITSFDGRQRELILAAAVRFEAAVARAGGAPPRQVCHSDVNDNNVLVTAARDDVTGLLDWGDAAHCWRVVELAVAVAYAMLLSADDAAGGPGSDPGGGGGGGGREEGAGDEDAPLRTGAGVVAGYLSAGGPLTPAERALLPALVGGRVGASLTNGARAAAANPGNSAYLLATQRPGWRLLGRLQGMEEAEVETALLADWDGRQAAARRGAPAAAAVTG